MEKMESIFVKKKILVGVCIFLLGCLSACGQKENNDISEEVVDTRPEIVIPERDYQLYVAVPMEYMSMRIEAGFGEEVVTEIYPHTLLKSIGENKIVKDTEFCHVSTMDDSYQGYCAAEYCIPVSFECDYRQLPIVCIDHAEYSYEEMQQDIQELTSKYEKYLSVDELGTTVEGRSIYRLVLGNPDATKKILVQASIHGREYMTTQHVMKMVECYLANMEVGYYDKMTYYDLFDEYVFHIIPMSNPDGVSISQKGEAAVQEEARLEMMRAAYERDKETLIHKKDGNGQLYWYDTYENPEYDRHKNGYDEIITYEEYLQQWKSNANGIDINRNFDAGWEDIQQKEEPGSAFFKGYQSDSEVETQILEQLLLENKYAFILNYHAKGQLVYYDAAGNSSEMSSQSRNLASKVSELNHYMPVNNKDAINVVLGGFGDWAMLSHGINSITIEMGKNPCPLQLDEFSATFNRGRELWAKLMVEYH